MTMTKKRAELIVNETLSTIERAREYNINQHVGYDSKHGNMYKVFGLPEKLLFEHKKNAYQRNEFARGAVDILLGKAWQDLPCMIEGDISNRAEKETAIEKEIRLFAKRTKLWQALRSADLRRTVGMYSALIVEMVDDDSWSQEITGVLRPERIKKFTPCWENQLTVSTYDQNNNPVLWSYILNVDNDQTMNNKTQKHVTIHNSRVITFGDIYGVGDSPELGNNILEPGYNAAQALFKIVQAGGEGFYKNAARQMHANFDKDANINDIARMMGTDPAGIKDAFEMMGKDLAAALDAFIVTKSADVKALSVNLPDGKTAFDNALNAFCASLGGLPATVIAGHQTGERASGEDLSTVAQMATSRRNNVNNQDIESVFNWFASYGMWAGVELTPVWPDLLAPTKTGKLDSALKMANIVKALMGTGITTWDGNEIRVAAGDEPLSNVSLQE